MQTAGWLAAKEKRKERNVRSGESAVFVKNLFGSASWGISPHTLRISSCHTLPLLPTRFSPPSLSLSFLSNVPSLSPSPPRPLPRPIPAPVPSSLSPRYLLFLAFMQPNCRCSAATRYSFLSVQDAILGACRTIWSSRLCISGDIIIN